MSLDDFDAESFNKYKQTRGYGELIEELRELIPPELSPKYRAELYQVYLLYVKTKPKAPTGPRTPRLEPGVHKLQYAKVKERLEIQFANGDVFCFVETTINLNRSGQSCACCVPLGTFGQPPHLGRVSVIDRR